MNVKRMREAIVEHFDVKESVIKWSPGDYEDEFILQKTGGHARPIEVVTRRVAISNEKYWVEDKGEKMEDYISENDIGAYQRLGESNYFYRDL